MKTLTDFCKTVETGVDPRLTRLTSHPKPRVGKLKGDQFGKERSDFNVRQRKQID